MHDSTRYAPPVPLLPAEVREGGCCVRGLEVLGLAPGLVVMMDQTHRKAPPIDSACKVPEPPGNESLKTPSKKRKKDK